MRMHKIKINKTSRIQLDWLVSKCEGYNFLISEGKFCFLGEDGVMYPYQVQYRPSVTWSQGGLLLEKYSIGVARGVDSFVAYINKYWWPEADGGTETRCETEAEGSDYMEAAMRCYVVSKLGDEVEVLVNEL